MNIQHSSRGHSLYSPSAAHRWTNCPGSPILIQKLEEEGIPLHRRESDRAELGTALHEMCEYAILENCAFDKAANWAAEGHPKYAEEILASKDAYEQYVKRIRGHMDDGYCTFIEHPMKVEGSPIFGTADAIMHSDHWNTLRVFDIKTGNHQVSAEMNIQLIIYAALALDEFKAVLKAPKETRVVLSIFQPTEKPYWSEWLTTGRKVLEIWDEVNEKARLPLTRDNLVSKGKQCRWCPAKYQCPAYAKWIGATLNPRTAKFLDSILGKRFKEPGGFVDRL